MNNFKKTGGFTLVELIVVIAILGILAAVAIPAYSGYITKANDASVITKLDAIQSAAQAANAKEGAISKIEVSGTTATVTATKLADDFDTNIVMFYDAASACSSTDSNPTSASVTITAIDWSNTSYKGKTTLTWENNEWK